MVFDDCLSAVDAKTENDIVNNLDKFLHNKTAIIITHRIFSSFRFNKIVVLEDGMITEEGTHEKIIRTKRLLCRIISFAINRSIITRYRKCCCLKISKLPL